MFDYLDFEGLLLALLFLLVLWLLLDLFGRIQIVSR